VKRARFIAPGPGWECGRHEGPIPQGRTSNSLLRGTGDLGLAANGVSHRLNAQELTFDHSRRSFAYPFVDHHRCDRLCEPRRLRNALARRTLRVVNQNRNARQFGRGRAAHPPACLDGPRSLDFRSRIVFRCRVTCQSKTTIRATPSRKQWVRIDNRLSAGGSDTGIANRGVVE